MFLPRLSSLLKGRRVWFFILSSYTYPLSSTFTSVDYNRWKRYVDLCFDKRLSLLQFLNFGTSPTLWWTLLLSLPYFLFIYTPFRGVTLYKCWFNVNGVFVSVPFFYIFYIHLYRCISRMLKLMLTVSHKEGPIWEPLSRSRIFGPKYRVLTVITYVTHSTTSSINVHQPSTTVPGVLGREDHRWGNTLREENIHSNWITEWRFLDSGRSHYPTVKTIIQCFLTEDRNRCESERGTNETTPFNFSMCTTPWLPLEVDWWSFLDFGSYVVGRSLTGPRYLCTHSNFLLGRDNSKV